MVPSRNVTRSCPSVERDYVFGLMSHQDFNLSPPDLSFTLIDFLSRLNETQTLQKYIYSKYHSIYLTSSYFTYPFLFNRSPSGLSKSFQNNIYCPLFPTWLNSPCPYLYKNKILSSESSYKHFHSKFSNWIRIKASIKKFLMIINYRRDCSVIGTRSELSWYNPFVGSGKVKGKHTVQFY